MLSSSLLEAAFFPTLTLTLRYHPVRLQSVYTACAYLKMAHDSDVGSAEARKTKIGAPEGQRCLSNKSPLILGKRHTLYHYFLWISTKLDRSFRTLVVSFAVDFAEDLAI